MSKAIEQLASTLRQRFPQAQVAHDAVTDEVTLEVGVDAVRDTALVLRDEAPFGFNQLSDVCGVDYLAYGDSEWRTLESTATGFSRGVNRYDGEVDPDQESSRRFAVVYHLLSLPHNQRLRMRVFCPDPAFPVVSSVTDIWPAANWFEREAFDLYGIHFAGHPDLRRILTDYGFIGHPFRKDFPLWGHVEVRYDPDRGRVMYQPVSIEPRILVPKVIRASRRQIEEEGGAADHA